MINTQLGRRNLPPVQRIAVWDKFRRIVEDDNLKRKSEAGKIGANITNDKTGCVQLDTSRNSKPRDYSTNTRQQIAQKANVGSGTIARYDKVMNSDDEVLADLIETNIRRRGEIGGSAKKVGLRIKELERLYDIHQGNGSNQYEQKPNNSVIAKTQEYLALQMGMSVDTLQNYKMLADMIPELEELLDTGIVTKTTALAMMLYPYEY